MSGRRSLPVWIAFVLSLLVPSLSASTPPDDLHFISSTLWSEASGVKVTGGTAYVLFPNGVAVLDVSEPTLPRLQGRAFCNGYTYALDVAGDHAYVAAWDHGLRIVDVSDPANPVEVGGHDTDGLATDVSVRGETAYLASSQGAGLEIYDVSDPTAPARVGVCGTDGACSAVFLDGNYAYVADGGEGVAVIDVTDPELPFIAAQWRIGFIVDVEIADGRAYCVWAGGEKGRGAAGGSASLVGGGAASGSGASRFDPSGVLIYDISDPLSPRYLGAYNSQIWARSIRVVGNVVYIPSGNGTIQTLDVTDPESPRVVGSLATTDPQGIDVEGGLACIADGRGGLRVADVSDPSAPAHLGSYWEAGAPRQVVLGTRAAYLTDGAFGLHVMDVDDPAHPTLLGRLAIPGGAQKAAISEPFLYLTQEAGIEIADVSDPAGPIPVGHLVLPARDIAISGGYAYVVSEDRFTCLDISDPRHPVVAGSCALPLWGWNVAVCGAFAYIGNSNVGLRIVDISNPSHPFLRGGVDTFDWLFDLVCDSAHVYGNLGNNRLGVFDVRNPDAPVQIADVQMPGFITGMKLIGNRLFCAAEPGVIVVDVTDPARPVFVGTAEAAGATIDIGGSFVYLLGGGSLIVLGPALADVTDGAIAEDGIRLRVPSPIRGPATISIELDRAQALRVSLFDVAGRRVESIHDGFASPGIHRFLWNPGTAPAGMYFVRADGAGRSVAGKTIVIR